MRPFEIETEEEKRRKTLEFVQNAVEPQETVEREFSVDVDPAPKPVRSGFDAPLVLAGVGDIMRNLGGAEGVALKSELARRDAQKKSQEERDAEVRRYVSQQKLKADEMASEEGRAKRQQEFLSRENALDREARLKEAEMRGTESRTMRDTAREEARAEKERIRQEKLDLEDKELNVPGFQRGTEVRPTTEEAKVARRAKADFDSFEAGLSRMKDLVQKYGSTNMFGEGSNEMGSLATGLQLTLKNIAQLGVMSKSDADLLAQQILNPNEIGSMKISTKGALEQLDSTLAQARQKMMDGMASKGYFRATSPTGPDVPEVTSQAAYEALPPGSVYMHNGKKMRKK